MKQTYLTALLLTVCTLLSAALYGQNATIKGRVTDASGPLISASVQVSDKHGTVTDVNGDYRLEVPPGTHTLTVNYIGSERQTRVVTVQAGQVVEENFSLVSGKTTLSEQVVLGSRASRTKTETPVPVDVIPVSQVTNQVGQVDVNQILTMVAPSFQSARQTISDGTDHLDPASLRGLGPDQVLVLVNGKRRHQSALVNVNGTVNRGSVGTDMNAIPASAIEKIEILRDGAAAQYGSDAIAGVINIVLKKKTGLIDASISDGFNVTRYDKFYAQNKTTPGAYPEKNLTDGNTFQAGINYGIRLKQDGFLNLTGELTKREATNRTGVYSGQIYPNVAGNNRDDSIMKARGLTRESYDMIIGNSAVTSGALAYNLSLPLKKASFYSFGLYSNKSGKAAGFYRYPGGYAANAGSNTAKAMSLYPDGFLPFINSSVQDYSAAIGVKGKWQEWNYDISNTFGMNTFDFEVSHSVNYTQLSLSPRPQSSFEAGGLAFLQNTVNLDVSRKYDVLEGFNLALGAEQRTESYRQKAGEEASYKNYDTASHAIPGAQVFTGFEPRYAGSHSRTSAAAYVDAELDISKALLVSAALRFEHYSDFGSTLNYKLAARYKISPALTVRGSLSSGFRAPSLQQQYYAKTSTTFVSTSSGLIPVEAGTFPNNSEPAHILGIPQLKQETSHSYCIGFTAKPLKGLEVTADGYWINISDRIILTNNFSGGNNPALTSLLYASGANRANFFTNAVGTSSKGLEVVVAYSRNWGEHKFRFTLAGTFIRNRVNRNDTGGVEIKASEVLVNSGQIGNYFNREDASRFEVGNPQSKVNFTVNYRYKRLAAMYRCNYFGWVEYIDPSINPADASSFPLNTFTGKRESLDQTFSPKLTQDLSLSYDISKTLTATLGANNLFDVYPDAHTHSANVSAGRFIYSRRVSQFGFNGRYVFARLKFNIPVR